MKPALQAAVKICQTKRTTLQVLYRFAVRAGVLHLTDLEQTLLAPCEAPDGLYNTSVFLKSGNLDLAREKGADVAEYPNAVEVGKTTGLDAGIFLFTGGFVDFMSADLSTRVALTGVCVRGDTLVATDGHRLMLQTFPGLRFDGEAIIPGAVWRTVEKLKKVAPLQFVELGEACIVFHFRGFDYIGKLVEGPYPDFQRAIPPEYDRTTRLDKAAKDALAAGLVQLEPLAGINGAIDLQDGYAFAYNKNTGIKAKVALGGDYWPGRVSFNVRYLIQAIRVHDSWLVLKASGGTKAVAFAGAGGRVAVVMPLRPDAGALDPAEYMEV